MPTDETMFELGQLVGSDEWPLLIQLLGPLRAIADLRQASELQREYSQARELPEAEYRAWLTSLQAAETTNPFVEYFVTNLAPAVDKTQAMTVRSAMAAAGLAVMQSGPDALQSHSDPTTGQPFTYTPTSDGFELQSGYQFKGEPVKLRFK